MTDIAYFPATAMPDDDWWHTLWPDPEGVLRRVGLASGMCVVDLCCGNGHFTVPLVQLLGREGRVVALDMSPDMLAQAKARLSEAAEPETGAACDWIEGDACKVDQALEGGMKADALLMANTFHGVPEQTALSRSVRMVLKEEGFFVIINWHARPREETQVLGQPRGPRTEMRMTPEQVAAVVEPAGFKLTKVVELPPFHYGTVFHIA